MNVEWISRLPGPLRAGLYFASQHAIGSRIHARWRDLQRWTKFSNTELDENIDARLGSLLDAAVAHSAHYRSLGLIRAPAEAARDFLGRFPVLSREKLREQFPNLVTDGLRPEITSPASVARKGYDWLVVKTGGTTGVPTAVVHDALFRDSGRATRLFSQQMCGFPLGKRYFRLWGSEQDLMQQHEKFDRRVLRNLLGEIPMNAFRAREAELSQHYRTITSHPEIQHLMAYVDAAASLGSFIEDRNRERPQLKTIMACAGTVTAEWRAILQRVFSADVFDKYGSRECADIACECTAHSGLHVYSPNVFVEVVDDQNHACPPGVTGRILVTLLNNPGFPMIRYAIGDLGAWAAPGSCACELRFPRLASIQGREDDMLLMPDGTLFSSAFIRHFVGVSLNRQLIREWQFEQTAGNTFVFRYIPFGRDGLDQNLSQLRAAFAKALGASAQIEFKEVAEIPPSATGKTLWIINRMKREHR
ncbi:MAG: phenylacetate--CoA ligase family protein [Pedosphaera sp.]|nr:phenylacetate--CoA ligase family protein [Pedosphaera sp.]